VNSNRLLFRLDFDLPFWPPTGWYLCLFHLGWYLSYRHTWLAKYIPPTVDGHMVGYSWNEILSCFARVASEEKPGKERAN